MDQEELFRRLVVALAIGLLIGLERGWQTREDTDHQRAAGLRTFALTGLLGGTSGLLTTVTGSPLVLAAGLLAYTAAMVSFSYLEASVEKNFSATGVVAGILTFVLGAYATLGNEIVAVAAAVAMAILLALRDPLHSWVRTLTWHELRAVLVLLAMSFLLLPILPNRAVDPWGAVNPAEIWLLAIIMAAISFAGYVAIRVLGDRKGVAVAGFAGGLTSSTATTVALARMAQTSPASTELLAGGVLVASATMVARLVVMVGLVNPGLLGTFLLPAAAGGAVLLLGGGALLWRGQDGEAGPSDLKLKNPFELSTVLKLAGLIALVMLAGKVVVGYAGTAGVYLLAAASGIADVDAITLSMARLAGGDVSFQEASIAVLLAAVVNTASKVAMATALGGMKLGAIFGAVSAAAVCAALSATLLAG
jgi:uncharacterized membrane protein (DUF4010 family)